MSSLSSHFVADMVPNDFKFWTKVVVLSKVQGPYLQGNAKLRTILGQFQNLD